MDRKDELNKRFKELHNRIINELMSKKYANEIDDLIDLYEEYEKVYEELKNNYKIDYTTEFNNVNKYIVKIADNLRSLEDSKIKLQEATQRLEAFGNSKNNQQQNYQLENETIDSLFEKLIKLITDNQEFKDIKSTLTIINDINDLVNKIVDMIFKQVDSGNITKQQQNIYFKKLTNLGFKTNDLNCLFDISENFKKIDMLADEKQVSRDLGETNEILKEYLDYVDKIKELIEYAKQEGIICEKQVELYEVIFEEYKEIMFGGKRI